MRPRTFLQVATFLIGVLLGVLILLLDLPRLLEEVLGFLVTTITVGTMWALRARATNDNQ